MASCIGITYKILNKLSEIEATANAIMQDAAKKSILQKSIMM